MTSSSLNSGSWRTSNVKYSVLPCRAICTIPSTSLVPWLNAYWLAYSCLVAVSFRR